MDLAFLLNPLNCFELPQEHLIATVSVKKQQQRRPRHRRSNQQHDIAQIRKELLLDGYDSEDSDDEIIPPPSAHPFGGNNYSCTPQRGRADDHVACKEDWCDNGFDSCESRDPPASCRDKRERYQAASSSHHNANVFYLQHQQPEASSTYLQRYCRSTSAAVHQVLYTDYQVSSLKRHSGLLPTIWEHPAAEQDDDYWKDDDEMTYFSSCSESSDPAFNHQY